MVTINHCIDDKFHTNCIHS